MNISMLENLEYMATIGTSTEIVRIKTPHDFIEAWKRAGNVVTPLYFSSDYICDANNCLRTVVTAIFREGATAAGVIDGVYPHFITCNFGVRYHGSNISIVLYNDRRKMYHDAEYQALHHDTVYTVADAQALVNRLNSTRTPYHTILVEVDGMSSLNRFLQVLHSEVRYHINLSIALVTRLCNKQHINPDYVEGHVNEVIWNRSL